MNSFKDEVLKILGVIVLSVILFFIITGASSILGFISKEVVSSFLFGWNLRN